MALTNYERQKRWRERNRSIYNLKRRNARKNMSEDREVAKPKPDKTTSGGTTDSFGGSNPPPPQLSSDPKINELRALMAKASAEPTVPVVKLSVYRDDYGRVITERQWNTLQKRKAEAKNSGYEIDEFSQ